MKLIPMTKSDYDHWAPRSRKGYAQDKKRANGYTEEEAAAIAEADFLRLLPEGLGTKDNYLFTMKNDAGGTLGYLWFLVRGAADNRKAFIADIIVEEEYRGQGFGRRAMMLVEDEARKLGLSEIGLHVFGFNDTAISLYRSLGYETTDLVMAKKI